MLVMRLNRPTFVKQLCEPAELYLNDVGSCLTTSELSIRGNLDGISFEKGFNLLDPVQPKVGGPSQLLTLPHSFGYVWVLIGLNK